MRILFLCALAGCGAEITGGAGDGGGDAHALVCDTGQMACGGACADVQHDAMNCGACGRSCGGDLCCGGVCVATSTCTFAVTQVSPSSGWQNGGDWLTLRGAGFTPSTRVFIGDGRAPARVIDAQTVRIQTPPGPLGDHPVKIVDGNASAQLPSAFRYLAAGLGSPWQQKPLKLVRGENPGVAVMQDGRALVAGGTTVPDGFQMTLDTAEIYDRQSDQVTPAANQMSTVRWQNSAVTLLDGRVLVVGGVCHADLTGCVGDPTRADLFDPQTNQFTPTAAPLTVGRVYTMAVLLPDGRVFVASSNDGSVELFDPASGKFTQLAHGPAHVFGFAVRLRDGRVLLGGGDGGMTACELFDPDTDSFAPAAALQHARSKLTAHTLPDGRVIAIGGTDMSAGGVHAPQATMELYDPKANAWTVAPYALSKPRAWHASALVRDGTILVMGGYAIDQSCDPDDTVDQVDPTMAVVSPFAKLLNPNTEWNAVTLLDGSVLGVGGGACGASTALPDLDFLPGGPG